MPSESASSQEIRDYPGGYHIDRKGAGRQFDSDFLEFFSRCHGSLPLIIYGPIVVYLGYLTFTRTDISVAAALGLVAAGVFIWTFAE